MINKYKCKRCGWEWKPRTEGVPACCPKCKRYDWAVGEVKPTSELKTIAGIN